ncbi:MAG: carboxypeptidase regulatory-like domain-containing protein, partial [Calditrichaeota bacterium]|nr:carboxypeptidase regulatory-like domain-containing protein [Calditrichota bacterium]
MNQLRLIKIFFVLLFLAAESVFGAGITLIRIPEVLLRETSTIKIQWQEPIQAKMKFGLSSGNYSLETTASGTGNLSFVAADEGMSPGVYYCIISSGSLSSMEFKLIIESTVAPYLRSPVNNSVISTSTPAFRWDPVVGVPFYHLILSDQPVELQEDENGELVLNGGNIIWQIITPNTSVVYGEADPSGFFQGLNQNAPPIMANINYNWIVLNNYGNHPALSSIIQAGVSSFRFSLDSSLPAPALQSPAANVDISAAKIIFKWSSVPGAAAYRLLLSETIEQEGSTSSYILWNPVTTDTFIELQARAFLKGANYSWRVVALDQSGHGVASPIRKFAYKVPNATLHIHTFRSDHSSLPRVELRITPVDGSSELSNLLTTDSGVLDQLVQPGEYTVFAAKTEYADTLATIAVEAGETANVNLVLSKLIQLISGQVIDQNSTPLQGVTIYLQEFQKALSKSATTDIQGRFSIMLVPGTWFIRAEKAGYTHSDTLAVSLGSGQRAALPSKLKLVENSARLAGFVKTTNGIPIVNCRIVAASEGYEFSAKTDFNGRFNLELLAGQWLVYAEKDGFVRSAGRTVQLTPGQSLNLSPD